MPKVAEQLDSIVLVRSARAWASAHGLMQNWVQIGRNPASPSSKISPHIGSVVSMELSTKGAILPTFMALNGTPPAGAGYFPVAHAPFLVTAGSPLPTTTHRDGTQRFASRSDLLLASEGTSGAYAELGSGPAEMEEWKGRSRMLMYNSKVDQVFALDQTERLRYGNSKFGDACLTARNLLRANMGTRFIQITFGSWDHHSNLYP